MKAKIVFIYFFLTIYTIVTLLACHDEPRIKSAGESRAFTLSLDVKDKLKSKRFSKKELYTNRARFLAGLPISMDSPLYKLTQTPPYKKFQLQVEGMWKTFESNNLANINDWRKGKFSSHCGNDIFYPFSGPDIINAVSFFPEGRTYTLFGLEVIGPVPDPEKMTEKDVIDSLNSIPNAMKDILNVNFFYTLHMREDVGINKFSGTTALILFFLARAGYNIYDIEYVDLTRTDVLMLPPDRWKEAEGVRIYFGKAGRKIQQVFYFNVNVADVALNKETPMLTPFINNLDHPTTMMKAASYLLYRKSFDDMRNVVLGRSSCIMTDSSGMPYYFLNQSNKWEIQFHGIYNGPIPLFSSRYQSDLYDAMKDQKTEKLPFSYSYNYQIGKSHLLIAYRNKKNPYFDPKPLFDQSNTLGFEVILKKGETKTEVEKVENIDDSSEEDDDETQDL